MNWNDFVQRVPSDVLAHIYEYDDTYRVTAYRRVVAEFHENRWIAWKYKLIPKIQWKEQRLDSIRGWGQCTLDYVLSETTENAHDCCEFEPNINVYAALYDSRVRRLLWHYDPFSTDAQFMYLPNISNGRHHHERTMSSIHMAKFTRISFTPHPKQYYGISRRIVPHLAAFVNALLRCASMMHCFTCASMMHCFTCASMMHYFDYFANTSMRCYMWVFVGNMYPGSIDDFPCLFVFLIDVFPYFFVFLFHSLPLCISYVRV